jgi:hypothetical protein
MEAGMKKYFSVCSFIVLLVLTSFANGYCIEIVADVLIRQGGAINKGKIYVKGEKQRIETEGQGITIVRGDKNMAWMLIPEEKSYMDMPLGPNLVQKLEVTPKMKDEVSRKLLGDEVIDGRKTKKYEVTLTSGSKTEKVFQWVWTDIDFPVKMADVDGKWSLEYRNIGKTVSDSLFELPAGYERISVPLPPGFPGIPEDDTPPPPPVPGGTK